MKNAIFTIKPYKYEGIWVFDDPSVGLLREAFVSGADRLIDILLANTNIKGNKGFILQFSAKPFPDAIVGLKFSKHEFGGTWYNLIMPNYPANNNKERGWLCSALNLYYPRSPRRLFVAVRSLKERGEK